MAEKDFIIEEKTTEETKEEVKEETPLEDVVLETEGGTKSLLGATSGTDIAATSLDTKTTPAGTDNLILFNQNTNVGYQIDYDNLADAILNKITSKTYANQVGGSSAATLLAQLSTLNSNIVCEFHKDVEINNGYFVLPHPTGWNFSNANLAKGLGLVAYINYSSTGVWNGYSVTPQMQVGTSCNFYVRNGSGAKPDDGSTIDLFVVWFLPRR